MALGLRYVIVNNTYEGSMHDFTIETPAAFLDANMPNIEVDVSQSESGFTPIIGVNLHLTEIWMQIWTRSTMKRALTIMHIRSLEAWSISCWECLA